MDTEPHRRLPEITFRVLIIGRANAGKTSILQRVCETTESAVVYQTTSEGTEPVRSTTILFLVLFLSLISIATRLTLSHQWRLVMIVLLVGCL
jgi:GTPase SAR1 family protein